MLLRHAHESAFDYGSIRPAITPLLLMPAYHAYAAAMPIKARCLPRRLPEACERCEDTVTLPPRELSCL